MKVHVVLPIFNEAESLAELLAAIDRALSDAKLDYRIVAVNDGSTDASARLLQDAARVHPIEVITHEVNLGLGRTIQDGFAHVASTAAREDVLVRMDADNTHDPRTIPTLLAAVERGADVAIASRYAPGARVHGVPWRRRLISRAAVLLMGAVFRAPGVRDYACGYRAYRVAALQDALTAFGEDFIELRDLGFTGTIEKLIKFHRIGARFAEVPFELHYERKRSRSKMATGRTVLGYLVLIRRFAFSRAARRQIRR